MRLGKAIVKLRFVILLVSVVLLLPSLYGIYKTRINYDMLTYLPKDMDTVKGQDILLDEFGKGAFAMVMAEGFSDKDAAALKTQFEGIAHVDTVIWYDSIMDLSVPMQLLPESYYEKFNNGDVTLMAVFFDSSTSADETMEAVSQMRTLAGKQCFISGMSALVTDLKNLCEEEEPIYVGIAVLLSCVILAIFMDSILLPFLFLISIGLAIAYNLGSNYFLGEISYITKALASVLQLAVTMDYSIFLWHSYKEEKEKGLYDNKEAMAHAIDATITSVLGSSITTIAGFLALCFMSFTLGRDLGIVMAKGVLLGVIGCVTTLPALILLCDRAIEKTLHKPLLKRMDGYARFIVKRPWVFLALFAVLCVPAYIGYANAPVYYDFSGALPQDMDCIVANDKLRDDFNISCTHMVLADSALDAKTVRQMSAEMEDVEGVEYVLGLDSALGASIPEQMVPDELKAELKSDDYQLILINSAYTVSTDEVNAQIDSLNEILKRYDPAGMLIGEAPCTKDLIDVTAHDFDVVNMISIAAICVIIALVLKSYTLPLILVALIEFAIFINLGLPYYTGTVMPFIAPVCLSSIQLGATVDYAILMTTRYKQERYGGADKTQAIETALSTSMPSIIVSALCFFGATFGVALYSDIDIISSMCMLMARGALVSMAAVLLILPSAFMVLDGLIIRTSAGFVNKTKKAETAEEKGEKQDAI